MSFQFDHWEIYDPSTLQSPRKKKRVQYAEVCSVVLIPCRREYVEAGIDLWYHSEDVNWNVRRELDHQPDDEEKDVTQENVEINGIKIPDSIEDKMDVCDSSMSSSLESDDGMNLPQQPNSIFGFGTHHNRSHPSDNYADKAVVTSRNDQMMEMDCTPPPRSGHSQPATTAASAPPLQQHSSGNV